MTREDFEYAIKSCGCFIYRGQTYYEESELMKAFEDLGLIEQEPCEDAISRDAVLEKAVYTETEEGWSGYTVDVDYIKSLPPVKPQEPKTVLYSGDGYADGYMVYDMAECPNCGYEYEDGDKDWGLSFCPSCGQKLDWESEEINETDN